MLTVLCGIGRNFHSKMASKSKLEQKIKRKFICIRSIGGGTVLNASKTEGHIEGQMLCESEILEELFGDDDVDERDGKRLFISLDRKDFIAEVDASDLQQIGTLAAQILLPIRDVEKRMKLYRSGEIEGISRLAVGDRVEAETIYGQYATGTIRYCGPLLKDHADFIFGVEFDLSSHDLGNCDGSYDGTRRFQCRKNGGVFVDASQLRILDSPRHCEPRIIRGVTNVEDLERDYDMSGIIPYQPIINGRQEDRNFPQTSSYFSANPAVSGKNSGTYASVVGNSSKPLSNPLAISVIEATTMPISLNQRLTCDGEACIVRWIGRMSRESPSIMVGIEYERAIGSGTGCYNGEQLFSCRPKHGAFVEMEKLTAELYDRNVSAPQRTGPVRIQNPSQSGADSHRNSNQSFRPPFPASSSREPEYSNAAPRPVQLNVPSNAPNPRQPVVSPLVPAQNRNKDASRKGLFSSSIFLDEQVVKGRVSTNAEAQDRLERDRNEAYAKGIASRNHSPVVQRATPTYDPQKDSSFVDRYTDRPQPNLPSESIKITSQTMRDSVVDARSQQRLEKPDTGAHSMIRLRKVELDNIPGRHRGIQGHQNSCYLDSTLFGMFAFSNAFDHLLYGERRPGASHGFEECQYTLSKRIADPLRTRMFVSSEDTMALRQHMDEFCNMEGLTHEEKDPEEFLSALLQKIFNIEPLLILTSGEANWYTLFVEKDKKVPVPTVQNLFDQSLMSSDVRLKEAPRCLILQTPRSGSQFKLYKMILPSSQLDITSAIVGYPTTCCICEDLAEVECKDCYGWMTTDGSLLSTTKFCISCCNRRHKKFPDHKPARIPSDGSFGNEPKRVLMELFAVICIKTSHYVSFAKDGSGMWYFTDSMADREGGNGANGYCVPEVQLCPEISDYLESENGVGALVELVEKNASLPEPVNRFFEDCYLLMYQPKIEDGIVEEKVQLVNTSTSL